MVEWHGDANAKLNGHEFKQTLGNSEGQRSLVCCSSRGRKESDMTEQQQQQKCAHSPGTF